MKPELGTRNAEWPQIRIDQCCEIISGATPDTLNEAFWNGDICWVTPKDLSALNGNHYISETPRKLTERGLASCSAAILPANSVLFSSRAPIGHVAVNTVPMATNQGFKSFIPNPDFIVPKFLFWWLRANRAFLESLGNGATFKEVSKAIVSKISIPLPPLPEQKRIADILDHADALRAKRHAALAELDTLSQSLFLDMFGDPASNTSGWDRISLIHACDSKDDIKCGPFGTQLGRHEFRNDGVPLWGIKHVNRFFKLPTHEFLDQATADRLSQYSIENGDIVMTRKGTVGNCAVYPETLPKGIMHSDLLRIRVDQDRCDPVFLSHQLHHSRDVETQLALISGGAIMAGVNVTKLKELEVLLPPVPLQREFAQRITAAEELKTAHRNSLAELDSLFASLQHRVFLGEL
jgi:type I restriction enzyme, S subunit